MDRRLGWYPARMNDPRRAQRMGRARPARLSSRLATIFAWYSRCERGTRAGASETTSGMAVCDEAIDLGSEV